MKRIKIECKILNKIKIWKYRKHAKFVKGKKNWSCQDLNLRPWRVSSTCQRLNHYTIMHLVFERLGLIEFEWWRVPVMSQTESTMSGPPGNSNERIRTLDRATHAPRRSSSVNDAGALAPVVFSDDLKLKTWKIRKINGKGGPYPPKSTMANPLVASVLAESACNTRFDRSRPKCPNNGGLWFSRGTSHVKHQVWSKGYPELKHTHKNS